MSSPFFPKIDHLKFDELTKMLGEVSENLPETRSGSNTRYLMKDAALSAFSIFFTQSPSFLAHQKDMQRKKGKNNAASLFGVFKIPSDNQIRNILDSVNPVQLYPLFLHIFHLLAAVGTLDKYRTFQGNLLLGLDGVYYFSSGKIHCDQCRIQNHKNGKITYSHTLLAAVLVGVNQPVVLPMPPEFLTPQDGHDKQDSEIAAAKRWLATHAALCRDYKIILLADDIFCHQPFCEQLVEEHVPFMFVCKPDSHKTLYEWVDDLEKNGDTEHITIEKWHKGQFEIGEYKIAKHVPLRDSDDALLVTFFEFTIRCKKTGEVLYHNAFATLIDITVENVEDYGAQARTRWKVENENNNTLKNQGYHLEHNFGHGKQFLSATLIILNLLAFLFHSVLSLTDASYQLVREALGARETFFDDVRALTRYLYFDSFQALLTFMAKGLEIHPSQQIKPGSKTR